MITFDLKMNDFKKRFVDTTKQRAVDGTQRGLMYMGGYIARTAKNSIKPAEKHPKKMRAQFVRGNKNFNAADEVYSKPGEPPLSKLGFLRENIRYGWEAPIRAVVIGPVKFNGRGNAPAALELGIPSQVWIGRGANRRMVTVPMRARPYMMPALKKALEKKNMDKFFAKFMDSHGQTFHVAA